MKFWQRGEIDNLHKLIAEGLTYDVIAQRMGRTPDAVRYRARAENLADRRLMGNRPLPSPHVRYSKSWTEEAVAELSQEWWDGRTARQIGIKMHRTRNAIIGKVNRLELQRHPCGPQPEPEPIIVEPPPKPPPKPLRPLEGFHCYHTDDHGVRCRNTRPRPWGFNKFCSVHAPRPTVRAGQYAGHSATGAASL